MLTTVVLGCVHTGAVSVCAFYIGAKEDAAYGYICGVFFALLAVAQVLTKYAYKGMNLIHMQVVWFCTVIHRTSLTACLIDISIQHLGDQMGGDTAVDEFA